MSLVRIENEFQIVIPEAVRDQIGVKVGDTLELTVEQGKITLTPTSLVSRAYALVPPSAALRMMQESAQQSGTSDLTQDEIDEEIAAYRRERAEARR